MLTACTKLVCECDALFRSPMTPITCQTMQKNEGTHARAPCITASKELCINSTVRACRGGKYPRGDQAPGRGGSPIPSIDRGGGECHHPNSLRRSGRYNCDSLAASPVFILKIVNAKVLHARRSVGAAKGALGTGTHTALLLLGLHSLPLVIVGD